MYEYQGGSVDGSAMLPKCHKNSRWELDVSVAKVMGLTTFTTENPRGK